ncbi:poly(R)-hydroxyalkanoic acid synthase subunit PhaE [Lysobacter gummosus]|uniref:poly(R)-hydroxyalkanoic acid synthase subunit PhaE n=1 Tax=Lysobacter gummosus TaxID=262324 RepID=UPI00363182EB
MDRRRGRSLRRDRVVAALPRRLRRTGEFADASARRRAEEIEQASGSLGIPTRTEIDSAHRKIVQLERELRRLRDELHNAKPVRAAELQAKAEPAAAPPARAG